MHLLSDIPGELGDNEDPVHAENLGAKARSSLDRRSCPHRPPNNLLSFPYRVGFTAGSLRQLLEATGYEVVRVHGDALVPIADRWTKRWAAMEERAVKRLIRGLNLGGETGARLSPWLEMYARPASRAVAGGPAPRAS
ncbi:MAG: hypothetical protein WKG32_19785 [Gemmatimonadaceae bacterium]